MKNQHVDGKSFLPALEGKDFDRGSIFRHFPHYADQGGTPSCAIRKGDWKLIEMFEDVLELYNLSNDIEEKYNLSHLHPDIVETLKTELHAWLRDMNALIPAKNPDWQPWRDADLNPMD